MCLGSVVIVARGVTVFLLAITLRLGLMRVIAYFIFYLIKVISLSRNTNNWTRRLDNLNRIHILNCLFKPTFQLINILSM